MFGSVTFFPENSQSELDDKIIVGGGEDSGWVQILTAEIFDMAANTWRYIDNLPDTQYTPITMKPNYNSVFALFRDNDSPYYIYDIKQESWRKIITEEGPKDFARIGGTLVLDGEDINLACNA